MIPIRVSPAKAGGNSKVGALELPTALAVGLQVVNFIGFSQNDIDI